MMQENAFSISGMMITIFFLLHCKIYMVFSFSLSIAGRMAKMVSNSTQIPSSSLRGGATNNEKILRITSGKGRGEE